MSKYHDRAVELRKDIDMHHNCAQSIILSFAEEAGISYELGMHMASNFGKGMKMASTCGAITGGLMVLGLFGIDDQKTVNEYFLTFKKKHEGYTNCADLIRINYVQGFDQKAHCDNLVYEAVDVLEEILQKQHKI